VTDCRCLNAVAGLDRDRDRVVSFQANSILRPALLVSPSEAQLQEPARAAQLIERLMVVAMEVEGPHGFGERVATAIDRLGR
jgi:hypothetical protein